MQTLLIVEYVAYETEFYIIPEGVEIPQDPEDLYVMLQENPSYKTVIPEGGITGSFCVRHEIVE